MVTAELSKSAEEQKEDEWMEFRYKKSLKWLSDCRYKNSNQLVANLSGVPTGIRTPVPTVKGLCPRPLDDGDPEHLTVVEVSGFEPLTPCMPCKCSTNWAIPPTEVQHFIERLLTCQGFCENIFRCISLRQFQGVGRLEAWATSPYHPHALLRTRERSD